MKIYIVLHDVDWSNWEIQTVKDSLEKAKQYVDNKFWHVEKWTKDGNTLSEDLGEGFGPRIKIEEWEVQ